MKILAPVKRVIGTKSDGSGVELANVNAGASVSLKPIRENWLSPVLPPNEYRREDDHDRPGLFSAQS
jgi:hypothetical protein